MDSHMLWFIGAVLMAAHDAWDGYDRQQFGTIILALLWAFVAGLHFAGVVA